ncbi:MAG: hypothetical protein PHT95_06910 [Candidatus Omnitrophica bacterium]|nr:hypothetical protein [Candidatus Omnitrophota bacterium]
MRTSIIFLLAITAVFFSFEADASGRDDGLIVEYPDGSWGVDLGDQYVTAADGTMVMSPDYREDYMNTPYGALTSQGFTVFPSFNFAGSIGKVDPTQKRTEDVIVMYETTTSPPPGALWGFSTPVSREKIGKNNERGKHDEK